MPLLPVRSTVVRERLVLGGDAEEGSEGGMPGAPAVEAEDELIEATGERCAAPRPRGGQRTRQSEIEIIDTERQSPIGSVPKASIGS